MTLTLTGLGPHRVDDFYIARGEAMECAGSLDVLELAKLVSTERYETGIQLLESEVAMLTKMI